MAFQVTDYHAKFFAHDLTRQASREGLERLSMALFDANVDLNPHQIEAALFALRSPVSKGVILADEVGLGKTIEASLVLCQLWAERKRKLLVICPASIRKQWANELEEKFNLPSQLLDARAYNAAKKGGSVSPFDCGKVVICSLNFAAKMKDEIRSVGWNLVVIDEAHKLRNAHQPSNKTGQAIRFAVEDPRKILLTATPLQNSLMELYGMSSIIDEYMFGEPSVFRSLYAGADADLNDLKSRLKGFCKRTLRKDVLEYVQYTKRQAITRPFRPTDDEHAFYEAISAFLQRAETFSIPKRQRVLLTLRLRKILASSSPAIAGTLEIIKQRLIDLKNGIPEGDLVDKIISGEDLEDDDFFEESLDIEEHEADAPNIDVAKLEAEIQELDQYIRWARGIGVDTKSRALLSALAIGFKKMEENGAARKALIFTESRRTQTYVRNFLEANGFAGKVATFNGSNNDDEAKKIRDRWVEQNKNSGRVTGSRDVDARSAIIDYFKSDAEILIATEAAAEGVNLQFCSLVVNYDLPWNPQRIEQRIGRCHRYGQKHDVVVINFVNERNAADQRTFELLEEKFQLFDGVFGASDEVLGSIESGVDFEKRIYDIYQSCRTPDAIEAAFKELREQLDASIKARMASTRQMLLEFFDEEIHQRLRLQLEGAKQQLDRFGKQFWMLTKSLRFLETLNVFGVRADYMTQFKEMLEEEGVPPGDVEDVFELPVINNLGSKKLKVLDVPKDVDFKRQGTKPHLEPPFPGLAPVSLNWYPKIQAQQSKGASRPADEIALETHKLSPMHTAFFNIDEIWFELQNYKAERSWYNLNLSRESVIELLQRDDWYTLYIPEAELEFTDFGRVRRWQEIAVALLKKYVERLYLYRKAEFERPHTQYREITPDDPNFIQQYRIWVDQDREEVVAKLTELKELVKTGQLREDGWNFESLVALGFSRHLYRPLLHLKNKVLEISPVPLNTGERDFVEDLRKFYEGNREFFEGREMYLLRNMSRGRGIGFFEAGNFYPDFILWVVEGERQFVTFIDPKGIRQLSGLNDPKIEFSKTIKELEERLGDPTVVLNSFIVATTPFKAVGWWAGDEKQEFEKRNVLFQVEDKSVYIKQLFNRVVAAS